MIFKNVMFNFRGIPYLNRPYACRSGLTFFSRERHQEHQNMLM